MGSTRTPDAQGNPDSTGNPDTEKVGRRALLRRAATVAAAGIGGVAATEMLTANPAAAAVGTMSYGTTNNAGTDTTTLLSSVDDATAGASTLILGHNGDLAPLRLLDSGPAEDFADTSGHLDGGELVNLQETVAVSGGGTADVDTLFWMAGDNSAADLANLTVVLTSATGTVFAPVGPTRVLDTRSNRIRLASQSVLDSQHRLITAKTLELQLDEFVQYAYAVHINVTAVAPTGSGFLTVFGSQTAGGAPQRPTASSINFTSGVTIANHVVSPLSDSFSLYIYTSKTTHIVVDVQGFTLPDFSYLNTNAGALAKLRKGQAAPRFVRGPVPPRKPQA